MPRSRKPVVIAMAGLLGAAALAGCSNSPGGSTTSSSPSSSSVTFSGSQQHPFVALAPWNYLDGYNPLESSSLTSWYQSAMFDPPLAFVSRLNNNSMVPAIASHWKMQGKTLSIFINPKMKWSNGQPVTAQDVAVSLDIAMYFNQWMGLSAGPIKIVNSHEVQFSEGPLFDPYFVPHALGYTPVYYAKEFQKFIPSDVYHLFVLSNQSTTAGTNASTKLQNIMKKMEAADPHFKISAGPWEVDSNSTSEALFKPNPYFPAHQHIPWVELLNSNNTNEIYAWASESKFTLGGVPQVTKPLEQQWLTSSPAHKVIMNNFFGNVGVDFNTAMYPYNIRQVRQALAYLWNRKDIAHVANPLLYDAVTPPVGYFDYLTINKWLTPAEKKALNPYNYDPQKGVALLESVGFKKSANGWLMPDGKPFVPSIYAQTTAPDWEAAAEVMKAELFKVGIKSNVYFVAPAVYSQKLATKTGFPIALGWEAFSVHSYNSMVDALDYTNGVFLDYGSHTYTVGSGDIGPTPNMTLPNGQPINIMKVATGPNGIYNGSGKAKQKAVWQLSEAANYNLPMLPLWGWDRQMNYVDTQYYTGFPNGKSPWWVLLNNLGPNWAAWFYLGLVHPAK